MTSCTTILNLTAIILFCVAQFAALSTAFAGDESYFPDRRKPQFMNDRGYYVFPMPYSIPGVGEGLGVTAIGMNLGGTYTDVFGFALAGSLPGWGVGVADVHLVPRTLILDLTSFHFGKSSITDYNQRGMQSGKHDFSYLQFEQYGFTGGRMTATFADRTFEVYGADRGNRWARPIAPAIVRSRVRSSPAPPR